MKFLRRASLLRLCVAIGMMIGIAGCQPKITPAQVYYTLTFNVKDNTGGTLIATANSKALTNNEKVKAGTKVRFTATPKTADSYVVGAWTGIDAAAGTGVVELIITQDVSVSVAFVKRQCTITFGASEGGSISARVEGDSDNLSTGGTAPYGSTVAFTAIPEDGYVFDRWEGLTDAPSEKTATYTVTGDRYVKAYFKSVFWKYLTVNEDSGMIRLLETDHAKQHLKGKFFIPTHVHNIRVIGIGEGGFKDCNEITEVVLPESIKYIDKMAFHECKKLTSITLSQSLEAIKEGAFGFCEKLKTIDIPNGIKRIEKSTFYTCQELENVHLPEGLEEIEESAFEACKKLDIYLPSTIKTIGKRAFGLDNYNSAVKTVYIPKSQNDRIRKLINSSKPSSNDQLPTIKEYDDTQPIP